MCIDKLIKQQIKTEIASQKSCPPSPLDTTPITNKWEAIAPAIKPMPGKAPKKTVDGIINKAFTINSIIPVPILPQGSMPNFVNSSTDSGCGINLK